MMTKLSKIDDKQSSINVSVVSVGNAVLNLSKAIAGAMDEAIVAVSTSVLGRKE